MNKKTVILLAACMLTLSACKRVDVQVDASPAADEVPADDTVSSDEVVTVDEYEEVMNGEEKAPDENGKISNGFMSITMPDDLKGTYIAYVTDSDIEIYEKEGREAGFGGFVFGVTVTDDPDQYGGMRIKIGELTDADGKLYHVLYYVASEVQWDYEKYTDMPPAFKAIYERGRDIAATLEPDNGGSYTDGAGTKGEDIFGSFAKETAGKIAAAADSAALEAEGLSSVYYAVTQGDDAKDPMTSMGVAYFDCNLDGVDEMFIGDIATGELYDIFALVNGQPAHVASGYFRDSFMIRGSLLCELIRERAGVEQINFIELMPNSTELFPQFSLRKDETEDAESMYAVSYDFTVDEWEPMTEQEYNERLDISPDETKLEFTPLKDLK